MSGEAAQATVPVSGARWRVITLVVMAVAVAAVLAALMLTLAGANRERDRALALQKHSYDVMILARTLSGTMARAEASLGRYVIAGDQEQRLGQIFVDRWERAGVQLDQLDRITGDDQQRTIDRLRAAYRARGDELDMIALSTRYGKNSQALARFYHARQTPSLTAIDRNLRAIMVQERRLLDARATAAMASIGRSSQVAEVLTGFGAVLVLGAVALGWITVRSLAETAMAAATAAAAEARAEELARAVADATAELRVQEARLRQVQKMDAVGQLTGGIAHDFNNMLAVVSGGLELAARSLPANPTAARRHIDSAGEGAARAAELTRRLLAFSREDQLKPEPIRVGALVAGMRDLLDRTLGDGVTVAMADTADGWCVRADKVQLENAILNLAVNARDAMDGRGELSIATGAVRLAGGEVGELPAGDYVAVSVTDTGCGMTPEVAERVFEPFFTTKAVGKGTGLGLSQIFAFAGQHGGAIGIRTAPGQGTTVTLHLPRDLNDATATARPELASIAVTAPVGLSVLVVEDDPRVLAATVAALEELGHRPVACDDPLAAPALLDAAGSTDLIVSDVLMPRQTGPEMVAALAQRWPDLPVLFVTGFAGETSAAGLGGRPVLRKPFTLAALEQAIAELVPAAPEQIAAE
ncbi:ATP-binding protein [uncultured Sphingomonas sp.]|uniref:ATP-binding protein n=1 Tax=uncultured Sphingomonas sp. TaxID=158754 RepID=UPI0035CC884E